ncbi:hypothetical protein [Legionella maioricensis]|uniref:Uncharacterized protein n=1 Tax=Legionella maioricensis TaxID=2896528 RepID=A0A9X2D3F4_9GAMM|nr:hypothetical protein [Legionella maioricensis]MCL9685335.1 hypothetical protein [Legionella maioricensis]MCL9688703.1 hypothetical protein [Legionella maioricensis]
MNSSPLEFHLSVRVSDLDESPVFYSVFLGTEPKDRTSRLVNDSGKPLDTYSMYHIRLGVSDKATVTESYFRAKANGLEIIKPPRTTWRGTPLHKLWLRDPQDRE